ncbi:tail fiber [Dolichospermum phage Dfl-JY23]
MTTITGRIGFLTTGKLGIKLRGIVIDEATTPNTTYLPDVETFFNITANVLTSVSYPETETQNVSATISVYSVDGSSNPVLPALLSFDAIIPNVASVEFDVLAPTGAVNNQLDTSALRIAKLIANDPALAQKVAGAPYPRGAYVSTDTYLYGEMVSYFGKNYISKSLTPITNILPTNTTYWYELVITLPPEVSVIATGSDSAYGAGWNSSLLVPTQNAVYDKLNSVDTAIATANTNITNLGTNKADLSYVNAQLAIDDADITALSSGKADLSYVNAQLNTKANLASPTFTGDAKAVTPPTTDNDISIATTAFVNNLLSSKFAYTDLTGNRYRILFQGGFALAFGSYVVTPNGSSQATVPFGFTYATTLTVVCVNGDNTATTNHFTISNTNNTSFIVFTGGYLSQVRVNYWAIGVI